MHYAIEIDKPSRPQLWQAARDNDVEGVRRCLARGDRVDGRGGDLNRTPMMEAAAFNDPTLLLLLLCHGADLDSRDNEGSTALHEAAVYNNVNSTRILISLGANINAINNFRKTPVIVAAKYEWRDIVLLLMEAGAVLSMRGNYSETAKSVIRDPAILQWGNSQISEYELFFKLQSLPRDKRYRVLLLNNNQLTSLPDLTLYPQLSQLEVLNLSHNPLMEIREAHLPTAVKMVYMGHTNIHSLSPQMKNEWLSYYHDLFTNSHQTHKRKVNLQDNQMLTKTLQWDDADLTDADLKKKIGKLHKSYKCYVLLVNNNKLTQLPTLSKYPQFTDLKVIDASHNQLTDVDDKHLPDTVNILHLADNNIHHLSSQLENDWFLGFCPATYVKRQEVNLQHNPISSKVLVWNHLQLTTEDLQKKIKKLDNNYKCSFLLINNNKLTQLPTLREYPQFSDLKGIDASHNQLTDVYDKHLPDTVKILHLGGNNIHHLSPQLENDWLLGFCTSINLRREVNLQHNPILSKILVWNHSDLTTDDLQIEIERLDENYKCSFLLINNNKLTQLPTLRKYPQFTDLKVLDASHNQLTDVDDKYLPDTVRILHLGDNNIHHLSPQLENDWLLGFCSSTNLKRAEVNLQHNPISSKVLLWNHSDLTNEILQKKIERLDKSYKCSVLLINNNNLTQLPTLCKYSQFSDLKVIDASHNQLTDVDDKHLPDTVKVLHLGHNNIHHLSPQLEKDWLLGFCISTNVKREEINLQHNPISSKILVWNHSDLTTEDLQEKIKKLDNKYKCSFLLINNNKLTQLPTLRKYPQFSDLKVIDASHNQLTDVDDKYLPDTVKILHLGHNNIHHLSPQLENDWLLAFCSSTNFRREEVNLQQNPISSNILRWEDSDLTDQDLLKKIERLDANYRCSVLIINNNKLTQMPSFSKYPQFSDLKALQASHNKLDKQPNLSEMRKLLTLILTNNHIKHIEMTKLSMTLETLNLSNNMIEDLPDMKKMVNLKFLSLSGNQLSQLLEFPFEIEHIDLDNNFLQSVRNQAKVKKLAYLSLTGNKIVTLFGLSQKLQSIHIKDNPIHFLNRACFPSEEVYRLLSEALTQEQVDALQQPPPQIFTKGYEAVIQYLELADISRLSDNSLNRMCLLGEATAGKTSLMQSLMHGVPCLTAEDDRTQVVDTHTWNMTDQCSYQIYDQGGHPIYAITNMFFMSSNNKNIVCHNIKDGSMKVTLDVLKRTIHLHPTSEIHFALTKSDLLTDDVAKANMNKFKLDINTNFQKEIEAFEKLWSSSKSTELNKKVIEQLIRGYKKKIKESKYFLLSSKLYKGILPLKKFLFGLAERDMITLPELWWKCYKEIDNSQFNFLDYDQFKLIFHSGRSKPQKLKKILKPKSSRNNMLSCLQFYHDCGLALWFKDHPKLNNYVFHNLTYLIDIMKAVFHHQFQQSLNYEGNLNLQKYFQYAEFQDVISAYQTQGLLSHRFLSYLWQKYNLDTGHEDILLEIMKSFDICYQIFDLPQDDFTLYFFPFFCKYKVMHPSIDLQHLSVVNDKTLTLLLECIFFNSIPQNLTEMFIVHLQRHAVENHYFGLRSAWEDGLLVIVGTLNIAIVSDKAKSTLYLLVRGDVDVLFDMWAAFSSLYKSLCGLIAQWHGVIRSLHIPCLHCVLIGSNCPYYWLPAKVFPEKPCSLLHVSCEKEEGSVIPAALITHVQNDKEKHLNAVKEYLWSKRKEPIEDVAAMPVVPHKSQPETLQLQNQERHLDLLVQIRGTFLLRRLLQKQVLDTWGHELELLLQDTSGGVIVKSGPGKDLIHKFQVLIYKNKQINLFEEEKLKLNGRNVMYFDITLLSKLLKVPKISGIKVTQSRWNDFQKGSVDDMLNPKKPGPPGSQEEEESICVRLVGWISVVIHFRNQIHNKTDYMNLSKGEIETRISYLSHALRKLMNYIGITEGEMVTHDDTKLFYKEPYTEALKHLTAATKNMQLMSGMGDVEGTSSMLQSSPQKAMITHYALLSDHKLTQEQTSYIWNDLAPCVCCITVAGIEVGSGFAVGKLVNTTTGQSHYFLLTNHHLGLEQAFQVQQRCQADFGFYKLRQPSVVTVDIVPHIFASSTALDYVFVCLNTSPILDNFLSQRVHLGGLITRYKPIVNDPLVIIGHPQGKQLKIDPSVSCVQTPALHPSSPDLSQSIFYQCSSYHGASGSPCFSVAQKKLCGLHSGGIINGKVTHVGASSKVEYSIHLWEVISDIRQQIMAQTFRPHVNITLTVDELYKIFPHVRP